MKSLLIGLSLFKSFTFLGVAENEHMIYNNNQEGYYIEENLDIQKGDTVLIVGDNVYVIDSIKE